MELYQAVLDILDTIVASNLVRNIGVRVSDLVNFKSNQISFFDNQDQNDDKIQKMVDDINEKYNDLKIMPAIFYKKDKNE